MWRKASFEEPATRAGRARASTSLSVAFVASIVIYGLAAGVLAVGASALVDRASSLLVAATVTLIAALYGDSVLRWLLPLPPRRHSARRRATRHL